MSTHDSGSSTDAVTGELDVLFGRVKQLRKDAECLIDFPPLPELEIPEWRPSDGFDIQHQKTMAFYNQLWGIRGLNRYLANRAEAIIELNDTADRSYQHIYNDFHHNAGAAESYLAAIHEDTLSTVVNGTFFHRQSIDADFRERVEETTKLVPLPGIYLVGWARSSKEKEHAGKGLSMNELKKVCEHMARYIDLTDVAFCDTAKEIDGAIPNKACQDRDYANDRRYRYFIKQQANFDTIQAWLDVMTSTYLQNQRNWRVNGCPAGVSLDEPLARVFVYCGWGMITSLRAQTHESHPPNESPLYGLFSATVVYLYRDKFEYRGMQLFRCFDARDARICEILGHDISSSRLSDCGLNGAAPGGVGANNVNFSSPVWDLIWQRNRDFIRGSDLVTYNLERTLEKYARMKRIIEAIPTIDADLAQARQKARDLYDKVEKLAEKVEVLEIIKDIEALDEADAKCDKALAESERTQEN